MDPETESALKAGWRRRDIIWERLQESANGDWVQSRNSRAVFCFLSAFVLSEFGFGELDPRRATGLANAAFVLRKLGADFVAGKAYERAADRWLKSTADFSELEIKPRARSSLHHLRMEVRHWHTYQANIMARTKKFASETSECLNCAVSDEPFPYRMFSRWKGEKPPVFDDIRKLLGACLLVASDSESPETDHKRHLPDN